MSSDQPRAAAQWLHRRWFGLGLLAVVAAAPTIAFAHEIAPVVATLEVVEDAILLDIRLDLEAFLVNDGPGGPHEDHAGSAAADTGYRALQAESAAELRARFDAQVPQFVDQVYLGVSGKRVTFELVSVDIPTFDGGGARASLVHLQAKTLGRPRVEELSWWLQANFGDNIIRVRDTSSGEIVAAQFLAAGERWVQVPRTQTSWLGTLWHYVPIGFRHILPGGLDHMVFVLGLFLFAPGLKQLLVQVSVFTVAHTVSLGLGAADIVTVTPALVEPFIAASIIYIAIENARGASPHWSRLWVVLAFGLLHGLGFSSALSEVGVAPQHFVPSLLGFNLGVECGQVAVLLILAVCLGPLTRRTWYRRAVVLPLSALSIGIGCYWILDRTSHLWG